MERSEGSVKMPPQAGFFPEKPPSCPSWPASRSNTPDTVVSVMAGLPSFRAEELEKWNLTAAECSGCLTVVPHSQLYVCCSTGECEYKLKSRVAVRTPTQFFNLEKVFCGTCSFRGFHKKHMSYMQSAQKLAIKAASLEVGPMLEEYFIKLAFINNEEPVDYMISSEFNTQQLPLIPIVNYLLASEDTAEWLQKKRTLEQVGEAIQKCRRDGHEYVKQMAKTALDTYTQLTNEIDRDLTIVKPELKEKMKAKHEAHQEKMHLPPATSDPKSWEPKKERLPSSASLSASLPSQSYNLSIPDDDPPPSPAVPASPAVSKRSITESQPSRSDESLVKMMCSNLTQRFDTIRDDLQLEEALQDVSNTLHEAYGSDEHKLAAAKMFKEKTTFALYYPPPSR